MCNVLRNPPAPLISSVDSNKRSVFLWGLTRIEENHPCYLLEGYFHIQCIQISAAALHLYKYIDIYRERNRCVYTHTHIYMYKKSHTCLILPKNVSCLLSYTFLCTTEYAIEKTDNLSPSPPFFSILLHSISYFHTGDLTLNFYLCRPDCLWRGGYSGNCNQIHTNHLFDVWVQGDQRWQNTHIVSVSYKSSVTTDVQVS